MTTCKLPLATVLTSLRKNLAILRQRKQRGEPVYLDLNAITKVVRRATLRLHRYGKESANQKLAGQDLEDLARQVLAACIARRLCTLRQPLVWLKRGQRKQADFFATLMREVRRLPNSVQKLTEQVAEKPLAHYRRQYAIWRRAGRFLGRYDSAAAIRDRRELRRLAGLVRRAVD
jgi:hypothetical protein